MLTITNLLLFFLVFSGSSGVWAASRTSPPAGAKVVRAGTTTAGEFKTLTDAINSLPNDGSSQSIFIFPGTYTERVVISRTGPLTIYGYTASTSTYTGNQATIQDNIPASTAGSNDASATISVHKDDLKLYNINIKNTFGIGSQAIALSQNGNRVGVYGCGLYGYQDTLLANQGTQVYLRGYIEGATDFIFGMRGQAYFGGNTIAVKAAGWVTANGRVSDDTGSYVFDHNTIVLAAGAASSANGGVYLGRPWRDFAKVIFKNTVITAPLNKAIWSIWSTATPNTDHAFFAEFNSTGSGVAGATRPSFATVLTASQAAAYSISSAVGSDYASWVDMTYFV